MEPSLENNDCFNAMSYWFDFRSVRLGSIAFVVVGPSLPSGDAFAPGFGMNEPRSNRLAALQKSGDSEWRKRLTGKPKPPTADGNGTDAHRAAPVAAPVAAAPALESPTDEKTPSSSIADRLKVLQPPYTKFYRVFFCVIFILFHLFYTVLPSLLVHFYVAIKYWSIFACFYRIFFHRKVESNAYLIYVTFLIFLLSILF